MGHQPLTVPYLVFLGLMAIAAVGLVLTPETHTMKPADRPRYHPQRISAPAKGRVSFIAALIAAFIAFAGMALFHSLAPTFLAGPLHHPSLALAGAAAFIAFAAAAAAQILLIGLGRRALATFGAVWGEDAEADRGDAEADVADEEEHGQGAGAIGGVAEGDSSTSPTRPHC